MKENLDELNTLPKFCSMQVQNQFFISVKKEKKKKKKEKEEKER